MADGTQLPALIIDDRLAALLLPLLTFYAISERSACMRSDRYYLSTSWKSFVKCRLWWSLFRLATLFGGGANVPRWSCVNAFFQVPSLHLSESVLQVFIRTSSEPNQTHISKSLICHCLSCPIKAFNGLSASSDDGLINDSSVLEILA